MDIYVLKGTGQVLSSNEPRAFASLAALDKAAAELTNAAVSEANSVILFHKQTRSRHSGILLKIAPATPQNWKTQFQAAQRALLLCKQSFTPDEVDTLVGNGNADILEPLAGAHITVETMTLDEPPQPELVNAVQEGLAALEGLIYIHHNPEGAEEPEEAEEDAQSFRDAFARAEELIAQKPSHVAATVWHATFDGDTSTASAVDTSKSALEEWLARQIGESADNLAAWLDRNPENDFADFMEEHCGDSQAYSLNATDLPIAVLPEGYKVLGPGQTVGIVAKPYTPALQDGPAALIVDAIADLECIERAECFDGATGGYYTLADGRSYRFEIKED